ncbi:MAG: hypothetical protein RI601_00055 [Desulfurivibrionaceae bacterium]|nr:hypothetical protein [Desulfurivibrionaceae bacterium]
MEERRGAGRSFELSNKVIDGQVSLFAGLRRLLVIGRLFFMAPFSGGRPGMLF